MKVCNSKNTDSSIQVVSGVHTISCNLSLLSSSIGKPTIEISSMMSTKTQVLQKESHGGQLM